MLAAQGNRSWRSTTSICSIQQTLECPYPFYETLHAEAPVHAAPELGVTIVSSYDLLQEVVHDPETYSSAMPTGGGNLPRGRGRSGR